MTRTHYTINDIGGALPWGSAYAFIKHLGSDSALARDLGKSTGWEDTIKTNAILADIFDLLQVIHAEIVAWATQGKKKVKTTPYPRPGRDEDKRRIGKGALPLNELRAWMNRRKPHG